MSLAFTLVGALIFAMVKGQEAKIPQEAIIGISYAVASAAVIVAMSKAPGESEHLRDMLVGNILSVQWPEVWTTAALYAGIGVFHYIFRHRFLEISVTPEARRPRGPGEMVGLPLLRVVRVRRDPVGRDRRRAARVLLLIVPSVGGMLFSSRIGPRLAIGWVMAGVVSILGMYFSVLFDLPTGATIVCTFGLALIVMAVAKVLLPKRA
jgi:zinc/manganese transport system permease protein